MHRIAQLTAIAGLLVAGTFTGVKDAHASFTTWYVSPLGADPMAGCGGNSRTTPYLHIMTAVNCAAAGDIVRLGKGTYTDAVTLDKNLALIGAGKAWTTISAGGVDGIDVCDSGPAAVTISGMTVTGTPARDVHINSGGFSSCSATLSNSAFNSAQYGVEVEGGATTLIQDTLANDTAGVWAHGGTTTISSTTISNPATDADGRAYGVGMDGGTLTMTNSIVLGDPTASASFDLAIYGGSATVTKSIISKAYEGVALNGGQLTLTDSTLLNNSYDGLLTRTGSATIEGSTILRNGHDGIELQQSGTASVLLVRTRVGENGNYGIENAGGTVSLDQGSFSAGNTGGQCTGPITGTC